MSTTTTRLPLPLAKHVAARLMSHLGLSEPESMVVGSVRRECSDVGDIELIAPLPAPDEEDKLYARLRNILDPASDDGDAPMLFGRGTPAGPQVATVGKAIRGLNPWFKYCKFELWLRPDKYELPEGVRSIGVDIFRYAAGASTNRGWIEIMRTGSAEFSHQFLRAWKIIRGITGEGDGSKDGFLADETGTIRSTPNELAAFGLVGFVWVPPRFRTGPEALLAAPGTGAWAKSSPANRQRAMRHLGIESEDEIRVRWNEDRLCQVGGGR